MSKEIILFRFHKDFEVVKNKIDLLNHFNDLDIYGLYGGEEESFEEAQKKLKNGFINIHQVIPKYEKDTWFNGDLALVDWYKKVGKKIDFDRVYLIEWDALILKPLKEVYKDVPLESLGLTWLNYLDDVKDRWYWTSNSPHKEDWQELLKRVKEKYNYNGKEVVSIFGLPVFPKNFLEEYSKIKVETKKVNKLDIPLTHDEIRVPLYAEILGFSMTDNGIYPKNKRDVNKFFNADDKLVKKKRVLKEINKKDGRRIFHPYRDIFELELIEGIK